MSTKWSRELVCFVGLDDGNLQLVVTFTATLTSYYVGCDPEFEYDITGAVHDEGGGVNRLYVGPDIFDTEEFQYAAFEAAAEALPTRDDDGPEYCKYERRGE